MRSHLLSSQLSSESPRVRLLDNCSTYGSVTDRCCGMKSPKRSPILRRWTTRSDTSARLSQLEPSTWDDQREQACWLPPEWNQGPAKMREVWRNAVTRKRNLR